MTIGQELAKQRKENPLFANHYVNYYALKDAVKENDVAKVMNLLRTELDKINDIVEVEWEALFEQLKSRMRKHKDNKDASEIDKETLDNLSEAVIRLYSFIDTNYRGLQNVMKKCTEKTETASCAWFSTRIDAASFRQQPFDELLVPLGFLYSAYRCARGKGQLPVIQELESQALPASGEGAAQVFFVPPSLVMKTKVALLKLFSPAATMGKAKTTQGSRDTSRFTAEFSNRLTQVYFESSSGEQYTERMRRRILGFPAGSGPKGVLLQCRMGPPHWVEAGIKGDPADPAREVVLEVSDNKYDTITATIPQKSMLGLLDGKATGTSPAEVAAAAAIKEQRLRPAVSSSCMRSAFGRAGPEIVTIDEQVSFRDEAAQTDSKAWCIAASRSFADTHIRGQVDFVGAILKVWLPPSSVAKLLELLNISTEELRAVPGFSEALHCTAFMHRDLANPLPPWIPTESLGAAETDGSKSFRSSMATRLLVEPQKSPPPAAKGGEADKKKADDSRGKVPTSKLEAAKRWYSFCNNDKPDAKLQVDCKTPLAIERTLLRWMRSTVLLGSLSSLLMSDGGGAGQLNGFLLGLVCLLFAFLPLASYLERSKQLASPNSKQPKVDRTMPRILTVSFCVVLLSTVIVSAFG